jgi:hypothetical protein
VKDLPIDLLESINIDGRSVMNSLANIDRLYK